MTGRRTPLQDMKAITGPALAINEWPGLHTIDLRVAPRTPAHSNVAKALGIDLAAKPGAIGFANPAAGAESYAMCLAPDWWLLAGFPEAGNTLAAFQNENHFSAVDVSDQRTTIALEGTAAREVLAHLWEQDLREKSFPVASVSQGLMAKAPVIVCHFSPLHYRVMVRSSFALHLSRALTDAALEYL